ncbi:NAD-dependent epimerase/dehydratase family protein, partial [Acetobacteraceae bacterium]|nr:NAD-dependent epimerase/dehydratase family protein [Candidatus Parcubacteria bacterium]
MEKESRIFLAGGSGLVGSATLRALRARGYSNILAPTHKELNLTDKVAVERFFAMQKPEYVILAAA